MKGRIANLHHWRCRIHPRMARLKSRRGAGFPCVPWQACVVTTPLVLSRRVAQQSFRRSRTVGAFPPAFGPVASGRSPGLNLVPGRILTNSG